MYFIYLFISIILFVSYYPLLSQLHKPIDSSRVSWIHYMQVYHTRASPHQLQGPGFSKSALQYRRQYLLSNNNADFRGFVVKPRPATAREAPTRTSLLERSTQYAAKKNSKKSNLKSTSPLKNTNQDIVMQSNTSEVIEVDNVAKISDISTATTENDNANKEKNNGKFGGLYLD